MEWYSAMKRKAVLTCAAMWMSAKCRQPIINRPVPHVIPSVVQLLETGSESGCSRLGRGESGEVVFNGMGFQFGKRKRIPEMSV